ncbi:MAG: hypothetical protein IPL69_19690 [Saprospiraceae bacterium]|nr:hypothetical protein [Candidatus Brachybacter algidus]
MNEQAGIQNSGISVAEMLDRISDAIISLNVDDVCLYVNPFAQNILEKRGINILGKSIFDEFQDWRIRNFLLSFKKARAINPIFFWKIIILHSTNGTIFPFILHQQVLH